MMVGRETFDQARRDAIAPGSVMLEVEALRALGDRGVPALRGVSLSVRAGEILGVAGVAGNGQRELGEAVAGLRRATGGAVRIDGADCTHASARAVRERGVGHVPEDRLGTGVAPSLSVAHNPLLTRYRAPGRRRRRERSVISLERRDRPSPWASIAVPAVSIATAFVAGAVVLWYAGVDPLAAYAEVLSQAFGSGFGLAETAVKAIPLIFTGLAVLLPARMKLWNIGAEGQLQLGAIGAAWIALWTPLGHSPVAVPAMLIGGMAAGAAWCLLPGALRAWLSVNETITTLLMNYVALLLVDHLIYGPWKDPASRGFPLSAPFPPSAHLPALIPGTRVHLGLALALLAAAAVAVGLIRTRWGFAVPVIGDNPDAARYAGISLVRHTLIAMGIAG